MGFLRCCPLPKQVLLVTSHMVAAREKERREDTEMPDPPLGRGKEPSGRLALERRLLGTERHSGPVLHWASSELGRSPQEPPHPSPLLPKEKGVLSVRGPLLPPAPFATPISGRREAQEAL